MEDLVSRVSQPAVEVKYPLSLPPQSELEIDGDMALSTVICEKHCFE